MPNLKECAARLGLSYQGLRSRIYRGWSLERALSEPLGVGGRQPIHGHKAGPNCSLGSKTYQAWRSMRARCGNPNEPRYYLYGARGITVCDRWESFETFLADMGVAPPGLSLDRYPDNDGNYEPGNCRWATPTEQAWNRRSTKFITFNGLTLPLSAWARELGLANGTIAWRLKAGKPLEQVLKGKCQ